MSYNVLTQFVTPPGQLQCPGLNLVFAAAGGDAMVYLATLGADGAPDGVLRELRIKKADIKTNGTATPVLWPEPVLLNAGQTYAIAIAVVDDTTALRVAQVGQSNGAGGLVTAPQAAIGKLQRTSPEGTVTVIANTMLRFDLLAVQYTNPVQTVTLGTQDVEGVTLLAINAGADQPEATARVTFMLELIDAANKVVQSYDVDAQQPVRLPAPFTGKVRASVVLRVGTSGLGAMLEPGTMLVSGKLQSSGTYITPAIATAGGNDLRVLYAGELPSGSSVAVHVQPDAGGAWQNVPIDPAGTTSGNAAGVVEIAHRLQGITGTAVRVRLTLTGSVTARPKVRNLRAVIL